VSIEATTRKMSGHCRSMRARSILPRAAAFSGPLSAPMAMRHSFVGQVGELRAVVEAEQRDQGEDDVAVERVSVMSRRVAGWRPGCR